MTGEELKRTVAEQKAKVKTLSAEELIREYRWYSKEHGKKESSYSVSEVYFEIIHEITFRLEMFDVIRKNGL